LLFEISGLSDVFQQMPLAITAAPPSFETLPPETAELVVIAEMEVVDNTGDTGSFFLHELMQRINKSTIKIEEEVFMLFQA